MGRVKANSDGSTYWDPNDEGPDQAQVTPEQRAQMSGQSTTPAAPAQSGEQPEGSPDLTKQWTDTLMNPGDGPMRQIQAYQPGFVDPNLQERPVESPANSPQAAQSVPSSWGAAPPGFDQAKWADPNLGNSNKYKVGRILASGGSIEDAAKAVGAKVISPDKIQYPDGFIADVFKDVEGAHQIQYTDVTGEKGGGGGDTTVPSSWQTMSGSAGGGGVGGSMGGSYGYGGSFGSGQLSGLFGDKAESLYSMLMQRAGQSLTPSYKDPVIANQVNAFGAAQTRASRDYIDDLAESRGPITNLQGEKRLMAEKNAQGLGSYQAQLMQHEVDARRQEIQFALSGAMGMLSDQQRMALQRELEYLNMSQRAYEFDSSDEFRRSPLAS